MDRNELLLKLAEYVSFAMAVTCFLCMLASDIFACMILLGMFKGEWAFTHLLAMLIISGAFAVLSGIFLAIHDAVAPTEVEEE